MPPSRSTPSLRGRYNKNQDVRYSPMHLFPAKDLSRFDLFPPKLTKLKENLKAARKEIHELDIQSANIRYKLALGWDSLSSALDADRAHHNELAMDHKAQHRELRAMHQQHIRKLEIQIEKESDYSNWRRWTPFELLLRWKSGAMDYSIFKDYEATALVRDAFELEAGLDVPEASMIALVSAQVAAGWYKTPIESIDWVSREHESKFADRDFVDDDSSSRSFYVPGYSLQNKFNKGSKSFGSATYLGKAETWGEKRPYPRKRKAEQLEMDEESCSDVYTEEKSRDLRFKDESNSRGTWAENYPSREYSHYELDALEAKANTPEKPKKWVHMIAGRLSTRLMIAEEYVD